MGSKYSIQAWGQHYLPHDTERSYMQMWAGQSLLRALLALWRVKREGWGCVTLECR